MSDIEKKILDQYAEKESSGSFYDKVQTVVPRRLPDERFKQPEEKVKDPRDRTRRPYLIFRRRK